MARTRTVIVIDRGSGPAGGGIVVYCNDPDAVVILTGKRGEPSVERDCGCCGADHLSTFHGDCRNDDERLSEVGIAQL